MTTLSGIEFNEKYPNTEFYKILHKDSLHFDFTYKHGLNVDHRPFKPECNTSAGGLYFIELDKVSCWMERHTSMDIEKMIERTSVYIAKVTIPSNASVYIETNKFKADQFVLDLDNKVLIEDFYIWENEALCKLAVTQDGYNLEFVKNQTDEICKLAVSQNSNALEFVKNPTDEIRKLSLRLLTMFSPKPNVPYKLLFQEMNNIVVESQMIITFTEENNIYQVERCFCFKPYEGYDEYDSRFVCYVCYMDNYVVLNSCIPLVTLNYGKINSFDIKKYI